VQRTGDSAKPSHRFDKFVRNKFGQPQAGPAARKRGGVRPMDGPHNPTRDGEAHRTSKPTHKRPASRAFVCMANRDSPGTSAALAAQPQSTVIPAQAGIQ